MPYKLTDAPPMHSELITLAVTVELGYLDRKTRASAMRAVKTKLRDGFTAAGGVTYYAHPEKVRHMHPRWAVKAPRKCLLVLPKKALRPRGSRSKTLQVLFV